ncbi:hypothetical protein P9850_12615 [Anoxybacillus rupiensis]|uniref:Uncharacterized protein n=1 Tax=Anoxybacteroides rupiense TaxID=311460 RepID=A0ABD5IWD9_9BACL|nr:hypothetical protein [Anoxybacillus rupiensis]
MIIHLDDYRKKKLIKEPVVYVPVFERVFIENNKLIGQFESGKKVIIKDFRRE